MKKVELNDLLKGAVSLEETKEYVKPWRIPFEQKHLFYPNAINGKAEIPAGVRIVFASNTTQLKIGIIESGDPLDFDVIIDGSFYKKETIMPGERTLIVDGLHNQKQEIEIYLSQRAPVQITGLWIDEQADLTIVTDSRKKWVTYGSSITQCVEAESPSKTWPALAASGLNLDLTCLGFSANCQMEPMLSRMIRDLPADFISLCVGINIMGGSTLSKRTFAPALIGFIQTIREKHPKTPMAIMSPVYCKERETTENKVGLNLVMMREEIEKVVKMLQDHGDEHIIYIDGLRVFGQEYADYYPDGLHPNAKGYQIMGKNFQEIINESFKNYNFLNK